RRALVADGEPQDIAALELRVRDEDLAPRVYPLEERLVVLVRALATEADEREVPRRNELPSRLPPDPGLEQRGEAHGLADPRLESGSPVAAQDRPELQRAEAATERRA